MLSEPMTLYKLMILYLLKQVNTALAEHRITEFFLSREYTSYFTLRQALAELCEAGLVLANSTAYGSRYTASPEGLETLSFFGKRLSLGLFFLYLLKKAFHQLMVELSQIKGLNLRLFSFL